MNKLLLLIQKAKRIFAFHINSSTLSTRLSKSAFWSLFGEILARGFMFASYIIIARILGKEEYGQFGIIRSTIVMFIIFGGMGLGLTANKYLAQHRTINKLFSSQIVGLSYKVSFLSGLFIGILIFIFAPWLSSTILNTPSLLFDFRIASIIIFFSAINGAQIGILQGLEEFKNLAYARFIQGISAVPLFFIGTYYWGISGAIVAFAMNTVLYTLFLHIQIKKSLVQQQITPIYKFSKNTLQIIWKFSIPAALTGIAVSPFKWLSETFVVKYSGFEELGIFQAAIVVTTILISISSTINAPLISISSNIKSFGDKKSKIDLINIFGSWYVFLLISIPFLIFPSLISFIFGPKFDTPELYSVNLLLLIYCGLMMYYQGIMRVIIVNESLWFAFVTNLFEGVSLLLFFYIYKYEGAIGLAYAYIGSYIIRIIISIPFIIKKKIISAEVLLNKYFLLSLFVFTLSIYIMYNK